MRGRVVVIEVAVDRVLIFVALLVVGLDAVLVEESLEEDVLVGEPGYLERRSRLHPKLVRRGAQHVGGSDHPGRSEETTSELQSLMRISYAVFCLKKKKHPTTTN